jgi:hypothetical protein
LIVHYSAVGDVPSPIAQPPLNDFHCPVVPAFLLQLNRAIQDFLVILRNSRFVINEPYSQPDEWNQARKEN